MADMSIGPPITYQVIRKLWPEHVNEYIGISCQKYRQRCLMNVGVMDGGQQFLDYMKPGASGVPMGLALL